LVEKAQKRKQQKREKSADSERSFGVPAFSHSSAFVFELFRFLFITCVNALLFSPTRNKRREVEERERSALKTTTTQRERECASAFLVGALSPRSDLFELFLPSSSSRLFSPQTNRLTRRRDKNATIFITIGLVVGATIGRQINLGNSQRRRRKRRGTFDDDDEREEYDDKQRQRWRQMGESEEEEKESNERL
jgi:hypothetical protein